MEEGNIAVLVDAKTEYTKQLVNILRPCIYQGIKSIYEDLMVQRKYSEEAVFGKNKTDRYNNAVWANCHLHNKILNKFRRTNWVVTKWDKAK